MNPVVTNYCPLEMVVIEGKAAFDAKYGFPAEELFVSNAVAKAVKRIALKKGWTKGEQIAVCGLPVFLLTKKSDLFTLHFTAIRDGQRYVQTMKLEPKDVNQISIPGVAKLESDYNEDDPEFEWLTGGEETVQ